MGKLLNKNRLANNELKNYLLLFQGKYRFLNSQSTDFSIRKVQISQFAKYRFSIRKVQILNSQSTDFSIRKVQISQFAKYRFSIRKVQISQFAKYRFSIRKVQIFNSQSTDFQFAKYRFLNSQSTDFSIRKVQISQFAKYRFLNSFRFVSFRFAKYSKPLKMNNFLVLKTVKNFRFFEEQTLVFFLCS